MNKQLVATFVAAAISTVPVFAHATGIDPTHISLPKGPASIEGLGRNFVPSLSSGTSFYGIDIAGPPAVAGFGPKLSLEYDSGSRRFRAWHGLETRGAAFSAAAHGKRPSEVRFK